MAFQSVGESTASLGEIRNRADLVIFWGGNPAEAHPTALHPLRGDARRACTSPNGKKDRTVVLVDVRRTPSTPVADIFLQVKPGSDFEVLWALRALVKGRQVDRLHRAADGHRRSPVLEDLVARMKSCRFGALLFGMGLTMTRGRHFNAGALLALATDLNEFTHFVATPVRGHGNVTGADNVVSWQTGYPFGVNFSRGYPRFNPGECTTVGPAGPARGRRRDDHRERPGRRTFPQPAIEHLKRIPVIVLDPKPTRTASWRGWRFTTATYGINVPGTVYRMDDVPITLRPAFDRRTPATCRC